MLSAHHRDISKVIMQFVVEEIDENTSLEDLQKMMVVALVYRVLVCFYEVSECFLPWCCEQSLRTRFQK